MSAESSPIVRAMLALHQRAHPDGPTSCVECNKGRKFVPYPCPTVQAVAAVLAADPEPRDAVDPPECWCPDAGPSEYRPTMPGCPTHDAAAALDASRGGTR